MSHSDWVPDAKAFGGLVAAVIALALWAGFQPREEIPQEPAHSQSDGARDQTAKEADLRAQQNMARAAWLQAGIGTLGLIGLGFTVRYAFKAWQAAEAGNAQEAAQSIVELRPYVFIKDVSFEGQRPLEAPETFDAWVVDAEWVNCGQTPARKVRAAANLGFFDADGNVPDDFAFPDQPGFFTEAGVIGPGQSIHVRMRIPSGELTPVFQRTATAFFWIWVEYSDRFSKTPRRRTEHCAQLYINNLPTVFDERTRLLGRRATAFNGADEDCLQQPKTAG